MYSYRFLESWLSFKLIHLLRHSSSSSLSSFLLLFQMFALSSSYILCHTLFIHCCVIIYSSSLTSLWHHYDVIISSSSLTSLSDYPLSHFGHKLLPHLFSSSLLWLCHLLTSSSSLSYHPFIYRFLIRLVITGLGFLGKEPSSIRNKWVSICSSVDF